MKVNKNFLIDEICENIINRKGNLITNCDENRLREILKTVFEGCEK